MEISDKWRKLSDNINILPSHGKEALDALIKDHDALTKLDLALKKRIASYGYTDFLNSYYGMKDRVEFHELQEAHSMHNNYWKESDPFRSFCDQMGVNPSLYYLTDSQTPMVVLANMMYNRHVSLTGSMERQLVMASIHLSILRLSHMSMCGEATKAGDEGMITYCKDFKSRDREGKLKMTKTKFSRFVNTNFPTLPEKFVDALNDVWRDSHGKFDAEKYHFHCGRGEEHFVAAYENTNVGFTTNIRTTIFNKSLSNSCMQYERDDEDGWVHEARYSGVHPVAAYAIPKEKEGRFFEILYMTDSPEEYSMDCTIFARVVFSRRLNDGGIEWGPLYSCGNMYRDMMMRKMVEMTEKAGNLSEFEKILEKIDSKDYYRYPEIWHGAQLAAINTEGYHISAQSFLDYECDNYIVSPYIDVGRKAAFPIIGEDGKLYVGVVGSRKDIEGDERFIEDEVVYLSETHKTTVFSMENHQGVNYLPNVETMRTCSCCEGSFGRDYINKVFVVTTLNESPTEQFICTNCLNTCYVFDEGTGYYIHEDNLDDSLKVTLDINKPMGTREFVNVFNVQEDDDMLYALRHYMSSPPKRIFFTPTEDEELVFVEEVIIGAQRYTCHNVWFPKNMTIEYQGANYLKYDARVCWSAKDRRLIVSGEKNVCTFYISSTNVSPVFRMHIDDLAEEKYYGIIHYGEYMNIFTFMKLCGMDKSFTVKTEEDLIRVRDFHLASNRDYIRLIVKSGSDVIPAGIVIELNPYLDGVNIHSDSFSETSALISDLRRASGADRIMEVLGEGIELEYLHCNEKIESALSAHEMVPLSEREFTEFINKHGLTRRRCWRSNTTPDHSMYTNIDTSNYENLAFVFAL